MLYFIIYLSQSNKDKFIKNHYLTKTQNGYYFKYGSKQDSYPFLNSIGQALDLTVDDIKSKIISALEKDRSEQVYTSLNNGDIKTQFGDKDNFIKFIKNNSNLDYELMNNLLSIPGILSKEGLNILVFSKKVTIIKVNKLYTIFDGAKITQFDDYKEEESFEEKIPERFPGTGFGFNKN